MNTTKTKDKENIGKTYVSSLWIFSPSLLYIQDLRNSYKNIQKDRIKKSCPWNHTRSSSFSVLMNNFSHLRWSWHLFNRVLLCGLSSHESHPRGERGAADGICDFWDPPINLTPWFSPLFALSHLFSAHDWPHTNKWLSCPLKTWILYLWQLAFRVNKKLISNDKISNPSKNRIICMGKFFICRCWKIFQK